MTLLDRGIRLAAVLAVLAALLSATTTSADPPKAEDSLIVHEWGTFLTVQGSDGVALGGMVDSEEALPPFVESRSNNGIWNRTHMFTKMETPVTYFYTDKPRVVQMRVDMPRGVLTHWYPMVSAFGPPPAAKAPASGSFLQWRHIHLIPQTPRLQLEPGASIPMLWRVKDDDPWQFARQTDSAFVQIWSRNLRDWSVSDYDYEKFLFYRGLGTFTLPLQIRSSGDNDHLQLTLHNTSKQPLRAVFAVWVENNTLRYGALADLAGGAARDVSAGSIFGRKIPLQEGTAEVKTAVAKALEGSGLYPREAMAMVNTWERSYFRTPGLRVLYVLPRPAVDAAIPIQIKPAPDQLVRTMVGRVEVLTPGTEQRLEKLVADLDARDPQARQAAQAGLAQFGRLREPVLHRIAAATKDPGVRARAEQLITSLAAQK